MAYMGRSVLALKCNFCLEIVLLFTILQEFNQCIEEPCMLEIDPT
jgi:hypothetical protein